MRTTWSEVSKGRYQRSLGANEKFIKFVGDRAHQAGREQWSVSITASLKAPEASRTPRWLSSLREAWKLFRFEHPSIASTPEGEYLEYVVPDAARLDDWINETFFIIEDSEKDARDVIANLRPGKFLTMHFLPHRSEFVLHTAHWRTDGYGAFYLMNCFFHAVKIVIDNAGLPDLSWGDEISRLVPGLEEALGLPEQDTPEAAAAAKGYINTQVLLKDSAGIGYHGNAATRPKGTRSVRVEISKDDTDALRASCELHGISWFSAVHAALASIHFGHKGQSTNSEQFYASTIRLNMRPYLLPPYHGPAGACSIYTGGYRYQVSSAQSFIEIAKQYHREYAHGVSDTFLQSRRQFAVLVLEGLQKGLPISSPPPSNIDISIVNEADQIFSPALTTKEGALEVLHVNVGVETLTRQPYLFLWTFRGQLNLSLWYNEAFQDTEMATTIMQSVCRVLATELGLTIQLD